MFALSGRAQHLNSTAGAFDYTRGVDKSILTTFWKSVVDLWRNYLVETVGETTWRRRRTSDLLRESHAIPELIGQSSKPHAGLAGFDSRPWLALWLLWFCRAVFEWLSKTKAIVRFLRQSFEDDAQELAPFRRRQFLICTISLWRRGCVASSHHGRETRYIARKGEENMVRLEGRRCQLYKFSKKNPCTDCRCVMLCKKTQVDTGWTLPPPAIRSATHCNYSGCDRWERSDTWMIRNAHIV